MKRDLGRDIDQPPALLHDCGCARPFSSAAGGRFGSRSDPIRGPASTLAYNGATPLRTDSASNVAPEPSSTPELGLATNLWRVIAAAVIRHPNRIL